MEPVVSADVLLNALRGNKNGVIDIGDDANKFRDAVSDTREGGTTILVGPRFVQSDGRVSQHVSLGDPLSAKSAISL